MNNSPEVLNKMHVYDKKKQKHYYYYFMIDKLINFMK